ncbi:MAG: hypothetical protein E7474_05155 [Ruminococcaceae bacterium]|nr:hypothetical protein [Oscillospiraceae bacterium]
MQRDIDLRRPLLLPILIYNGKRGKGLKWLFYIFYPAHLLLIFLLRDCVGHMC